MKTPDRKDDEPTDDYDEDKFEEVKPVPDRSIKQARNDSSLNRQSKKKPLNNAAGPPPRQHKHSSGEEGDYEYSNEIEPTTRQTSLNRANPPK